ncbi:MAG TPA: hypothetical protein VIJ51_06725 [Solirubrobacteraceae bacterium]
MTDARIEQVHADKITAREFLDQASDFLNDARIDGLGPPSRVVLLHNAAIAACDAILQAVGLRVTSGDRSHILRLETALHELDTDTDELLERLDASREPQRSVLWRQLRRPSKRARRRRGHHRTPRTRTRLHRREWRRSHLSKAARRLQVPSPKYSLR